MTAPISAIDLFNILRPKIGDAEAQAITDYVAQETSRREGIASKEDLVEVKQEILKLYTKGEKAIHELRVGMEKRFGALEARIEQNTNKLLIWLVSVIFASAGMIVTLIKVL